MPAVNPTIINKFGRIIGWNKMSCTIFSRDIEAFTELAYSDDQAKDNEYGAGKYPVGQSEGNYKAEGSITLFSEEIVAIQQSLPPGIRLTDIPPFPIAIEYDYNGTLVKDVLNNCSFKNNGRDMKQSDGKITHKMDLLISHIDWNI